MFQSPVLSQPRERLPRIGRDAVLYRVASIVLLDPRVLRSLGLKSILSGCRWRSPVGYSNQHPQTHKADLLKRQGSQKTLSTKHKIRVDRHLEETGHGSCHRVCEGVLLKTLLPASLLSHQPNSILHLTTICRPPGNNSVLLANSRRALDLLFFHAIDIFMILDIP